MRHAPALIALLILAACGPRDEAGPQAEAAPAEAPAPGAGPEAEQATAPALSSTAAVGDAVGAAAEGQFDAPLEEDDLPPLPDVRLGPMAEQPMPDMGDSELAAERQMQLNLPTADHPMWDVLRNTRVWVDEASQLFRAEHPADVRRLAGQRMTIRGYMLPLQADARTTHFLISPYTPVCFFHPPAEPNEVIEVNLSRPIEAGYHLVEVTGTFRLENNGEQGLFFVIDGGSARIVERVDA